MLTAIGTVFTTLKIDFYLDIIVLSYRCNGL